MKNGLLFLLLLFSLSVNANEIPEVHARAGLFAKPVITSVDAKTTSPVTVIDDRDIIFVGKADAGRPVRLFRGTINMGQVTADNAGNFSISVSSPTLNEGTYNITVQSVNTDNTLGEASDIFVLVIDRNPPNIFSIGGATSGSSIRNAQPRLIANVFSLTKIELFETTSGTPKSLGIIQGNRTGDAEFNFKTPLSLGLHTFIARPIDDQGKLGVVSRVFNITITTTLAKPSIAFINGVRPTANHSITTNRLTTQISSSTVSEKYQLFINNVLAAESHIFSFIVPKALANGNYVIKARSIDLDGHASEFSDPLNLTVNSNAAIITSVAKIIMIDSETKPPVFLNPRVGTPLRVTGPAGAKVAIFCDGVIEPTIGTFNEIGNYATTIFIPAGPNGSKANIIAYITDELGNIGPPSNVFEVTRSIIPPVQPVITSIDGKSTSPAITNKNQPHIKGKAEANSHLIIQNFIAGSSSPIIGFMNADGNGNFEMNSFEYLSKTGIAEGAGNKIVVTSTNAAGSISSSEFFLLTVDKNAPDGPPENLLKARIFTVNGFLPLPKTSFTNNNLIIGVASTLGNKVQLFINDKLEGEQELKDSIVATFVKSNLPTGAYTLTAKAVDKQGKVGPVSEAIFVQTFFVAPAVTASPVILSYDGKTKGPIAANKAGKNLKISAPANAKLRIFYNTKKLDQVKTDGNGIFEGSFPLAGFSEGAVVKVTAFIEDDFGNFGPLSNAFDLIIDNVAPVGVNITSVDQKTGNSVTTTLNKPIIKGKTDANASVAVHSSNGANLLATVKADANGEFTVNASDYIGAFVFAEGLQNISAKAIDEAGNVGVFGAVFNFRVVANIQPDKKVISANNVLTPNGDGKNDFLVIKNVEFYPDNQLKIFDSAGRLIFSANNYKNDWDGKYKGNILSEGTYYYSVELGNQQKAFKSFITIIRKSTK